MTWSCRTILDDAISCLSLLSMHKRTFFSSRYWLQGSITTKLASTKLKQSNKWNAQLSDLMEGRSIHHFKTPPDYKEYMSYIAFSSKNYKNVRNSYAVTKKWRLQNFLFYFSKNSVIDKFLGSLKRWICPWSIWLSCDALWGWFLCNWRSWWAICPIKVYQEEMHPLFLNVMT